MSKFNISSCIDWAGLAARIERAGLVTSFERAGLQSRRTSRQINRALSPEGSSSFNLHHNRLLVVLLMLVFTQAGPAQERPDTPRAVDFFHHVQQALKNNDRIALAGMVRYPLSTSLRRKRTQIRSQAALLRNFDLIFDSEVRCAILQEKDDDIEGNSHGFWIHLGEIWFEDLLPANDHSDSKSPGFWDKGKFSIVTVNNDIPLKLCKKPAS